MTALLLICSLLFVFMRLETVIDRKGCSVRYIPLLWKFRTISWDNVEKAYVRKYNPVTEFGGWGIKSLRNSKAYNLYGNTGLQLELKNGKKILVGTQSPEEIEEILRYVQK
jgi:hypothetical protein